MDILELKRFIDEKNIEGLKRILKTCENSEIPIVRSIILESGVMTKKSVAGTLSHRPGRKPISDESRRRYGEASRRNWESEITRAKRKATDSTEEVHKKRSEASKRGWNRPGVRELQSKVQKIAQSRPDVVERKSIGTRRMLERLWNDPEYIEKQRLAQSRAIRDGVNYSFWNYKYLMNGSIRVLQSSYELRFVQLFGSIYTIDRSRLLIPYIDDEGNNHIYHPDFEYTDEDNILHIVEVKPSERVKERFNQLKADAANKYIIDNKLNAVFEFITEKDLPNEVDMSDTNIKYYKKPKVKGWIKSTSD